MVLRHPLHLPPTVGINLPSSMPLIFKRPTVKAETILPSWKQFRYHLIQNQLWNSDHRFKAAAAGRGSGKTAYAKRRTVLSLKKPNSLNFYALPTYRMAKRVAWRDLKALIPKKWLAKPPNETDLTITTIFDSTLYVVGMDQPQRIEGDQYDFGVVDEMCDQKPEIFPNSIRPALSHKEGECWLIGAPKPFGIGSDFFQQFCESAAHQYFNPTDEQPEGYSFNPQKDHNIGCFTWPSKDLLSDEEIESIKGQVDDLTFQMQIMASWKSRTGAIFYAFDPSIHIADCPETRYNPSLPIAVGSDFNVDPMCWVLGHYIGGRLYIFAEIFLRNTNTQATLDYLYSLHPNHNAGWFFFGDASSRARKTSASVTDYLQIKNDHRFLNSQVFYPKSNPPIHDRFSSTNCAFYTASGQSRCLISPNCSKLIRDLKIRSYKPGTKDPADYGDIGHISDGFGYICWRLFPPALNNFAPSTVGTQKTDLLVF